MRRVGCGETSLDRCFFSRGHQPVPTRLASRLVIGSHEVGILIEDVDQATGRGPGETECWQAGSFYHSLGYQSHLISG